MIRWLLSSPLILNVHSCETPPAIAYNRILASAGASQAAFITRYPSSSSENIVDSASEYVFTLLNDLIFPSWAGTSWDYNGTTTEPHQGHIACGYFVTTTLEDAGFNIPRAKWAQLASEQMILNMTRSVRRYRGRPIADVEADIKADGRGLYVVGLDDHTGFIVNDGNKVTFVHAQPGGVTRETLCSDNRCSRSRYRVVGRILTVEMMKKWLTGKSLAG